MWLTSLAIRRPVCIVMLAGALIVLGIRAAWMMPVDLNPRVDFPFLSIQTAYPGAGPAEIESQITTKIEDAVAGTNGIKLIASRSQEGLSTVNVEFKAGTSSIVAAAEVRERIGAARGALPPRAREPVLLKYDVNAQPILTYGLSGGRPSHQIRALAGEVIKPRLGRVPGVANVTISGGDVREIRVGLRRDALRAYGLGPAQIVSVIEADNRNVPVGRITEGGREYDVRVLGECTRVAEIAGLRVRVRDGRVVRLSDIADVRDTVAERRQITRIDGKDTIALILQKTAEANTVEVARAVRREMAALGRLLPRDVEYTLIQDASEEVEREVSEVKLSLVLGAALAVLVVYLFLRDAVGTAIIAISIPASIVITLLPMHAFGFSLNTITLLALSLSVGILVDDSVVVLENIHRHLAMGAEPVAAAMEGRREIGLAAIAITLTDVVVFLPLAFMEGITGQFFWPFGVTVASATLASLFISFTLTPMLAARWRHPPARHRLPCLVLARSRTERTSLERAYRAALRACLRRRGATVFSGTMLLLTVLCAAAASLFHDLTRFGPVAAGLAFAWGLLIVRGGGAARFALPAAGAIAVLLALLLGARAAGPLLRFRFAPGQDQGRVAAVGELPTGASLEKTLAAARQVERAAAALPEVESVLTSAGLSATESWGLASIGPQYFSLSVKLRPKRGLLERCLPFLARDWGRVRSDAEIADDLRARVGDRPGVNVKIAAVSSFYAVGRPLQVDIVGSDVAELGGLASRVLRLFRETPGVLDPDVSLRAGAPEQRIAIDRVRAASLGIPPADVAKTLYVCLEGDDTNVYREDGIDIPIRVRLDEAHRRDARDLGGIVLESAAGAGGPDGADRSVVLADVARIGFAHGPARIDRMDREKMVSVTANVRAGFAPGNLQLDLDRRLRRMDFLHSRWKWDGENRVVLEEGRYIAGAMLLAVALVYTLMAALFDSLLHPFVIMLSLPQALAGALLALALTGYPFSIVAMVGIIMLVGLVTKNAILLVDYTNTLRERGLSRTQALIEAGPTRLRPILMTTIAMISGMLPTALGLGRGAEFRAPLAIPVIGGLILSTALTLLVIPCLYTYADDAVRLLVRKGRFQGEPCESPVD